ncbi:hypothetical protein BG011_002948 [Mortierella polycephala]|uniref:Uncharacterized protein n=1 Tax=Mortierella polycephala TaxID=41804 RepID=A0A9P6UA40_9FUNG|nr:hypothetical protein BG011_002948 [Mortierella polycephala]
MKFQSLFYIVVISTATATSLPPAHYAPSIASRTHVSMERRADIGNEYTISSQIDNSRGKHVIQVNHNDDSSVRQGFVAGRVHKTDRLEFARRYLSRRDLARGGKPSDSHNNVRSRATGAIERNIKPRDDKGIGKEEDAKIFSKRSDANVEKRDSIVITNVNNNSRTTTTYNSQHNVHYNDKDGKKDTKAHGRRPQKKKDQCECDNKDRDRRGRGRGKDQDRSKDKKPLHS